ncbi:hypothetical protein MNB_SUP05-5-474 [hydrothermal vent metagenome]|uniref:Uncharacterized protein n=1 Tax=hydrothermal vent metagenome TaxID=652676 RepID=A0A1W1C885_9ZZZZ
MLVISCDIQEQKQKNAIKKSNKFILVDDIKASFYKKPIPNGKVAPFKNAIYTTSGFYMREVGKNKNGCSYYTIYRPNTITAMRLYFLHKNNGFSQSDKDCL